MNVNDWLSKLPNPLASADQGKPRQWYRIENAANATDGDSGGETIADEVDVYVYGVIGGWWSGVDARTFIRAIQGVKAKQLNVHINSVGGNAIDGLAIFQALRNHPARIVTYVDALAASAASIIAMAGDHRIVAPYASVMVHRAWMFAIGDDIELHKAADELGRLTKNLAKVYANRSTSDLDVDGWLDVMTEETWYWADEAVEAGLMHEVQEDAEKTGDDGGNRTVVPDDSDDLDDEDDDIAAMNRFAAAFFGFRGHDRQSAARTARADADGTPAPAPAAADAATDVPAAEPEQPTEPKEGPVATLSTDVLDRLGLTEDADDAAVAAAIDDLLAKAENPPTPEPDPAAEAAVKAAAAENAALRKEVDLLNSQMASVSAELAATKATEAAATKSRILDAAQSAGKFKPADREQWEADYDEAPAAVTRMLDRLAAGTAVPVQAVGNTGAGFDLNDDAAFDAALARLDGPYAQKAS